MPTLQNVYYEYWDNARFESQINDIKELRKTYSHYPYLYDYNEEDEDKYLADYLSAGENLDAFVCINNEEVIGISIGCPLLKKISICSDIANMFYDCSSYYYFGDIIVKEPYWSMGVSKELYNLHIEHTKTLNKEHILALIVEREDEHPAKPKNFKYSKLWRNFGFYKTDTLISFPWTTLSKDGNSEGMQENSMRLYEKTL